MRRVDIPPACRNGNKFIHNKVRNLIKGINKGFRATGLPISQQTVLPVARREIVDENVVIYTFCLIWIKTLQNGDNARENKIKYAQRIRTQNTSRKQRWKLYRKQCPRFTNSEVKNVNRINEKKH